MSDSSPIAHVRFDANNKPTEHWLDDHLRDAAQLAAGYAQAFQSSDWAQIAGLWHDLGKYSTEFQGYIKSKTGYEVNAHIEVSNKINHSAIKIP